MASNSEFKHIKVNAQDDDVVIFAGQVGEQAFVSESAPLETKPALQDMDSTPQGMNSAPQDANPQNSAKPLKSENGYTPTTLEDIKSSKMPATQVIIIVIALLAIAAFVIWYVAFS